MDLKNIIEFVKENLPDQSKNLHSMLSLLSDTLADLKSQIADSYKLLEEQNDDEKFDLFREKAKEIKIIKGIVDEYVEDLTPGFDIDNIEESTEETALQIALDNAKNENEQRQILKVDYSNELLNADRNREHSLYEDFTHTVPCAFRILDSKIEADQWKTLLLRFCEYLYATNPDELLRVADDTTMQGSSRYYLSAYKEKVPMAQKMRNINLFVIGNISANGVRNYIMRLLSRFDIPKKNFVIFIRRDLSLLHNEKSKSNFDKSKKTDNVYGQNRISTKSISAENGVMRIGEFVRITMRQLSDSKYVFPDELLLKLTSAEETRKLFGIGLPFFKEYNPRVKKSVQIKDTTGKYNRYWNEIFEFNGHKYFILSQWHTLNEMRIRNWLADISGGGKND